jgi:PST family polysaccharide transporter
VIGDTGEPMSESAPASLTTRTVRGAAWTQSTTLGTRIAGLIGTLLLARFLAPDEYGEVMVAVTVTVTAFTVTTLGVGVYMLSNRELSRAEAFHASCLFLATGVAAQGVVWALDGPIGAAFDAPHLDRYMPIFVASALIDRLSFLPERMLIRNLQFRWTSLARAAGELLFTVLSLILAWRGLGAMSIAWAYLARSTLRFVTITPAVSWREWLEPHRLHRATFTKIVDSGVKISIAGVASFLMRRWDNLLVSRFYGNATMGAYNYAYNLADTPAVALGEQMSDVVAASFPHAEGEKRQAALVRACTMISIVMFPLAFGLGAVAETVGQAFFDKKWAGVGPMLLYLSLLSAPRPMAQIVQAYFYAGQRMRIVAWIEWLSLGALMGAIATIGRINVMWTCGVVGAVFTLRTLTLMYAATRIDGVALRRFLVPLARPLLACIVMVLAIVLVRPALHGLAPLARLVIEVALGAAVYLAGAVVVFRDAAREFIDLLRSSLRRR